MPAGFPAASPNRPTLRPGKSTARPSPENSLTCVLRRRSGIRGRSPAAFQMGQAGITADPGHFGGHVRRNVVGAVNPATGQLVSLIVPHCDTELPDITLPNSTLRVLV